MHKLLSFLFLLLIGVLCSACVNTFAVHELNQIATKYLEEGDAKSAIARLESSVDLDGSVYETRYNLAIAYLRINECQKALKHITIAETLVNGEPAVYYTLGVVNECLAEQVYEKRNEDGTVEKLVYNSSQAAELADKKANYINAAIENYERYVKLAPNSDDSQAVMEHIKQNQALITKNSIDNK